MSVFTAILAANLSGSSFRCEKEVSAYDPANPSQLLGTFAPGTELDVAESAAANGMVTVTQVSGGQKVTALCKAEDVGKGSPSSTATPPSGKATNSEVGFGKSDLFKKIQTSLVDSKGHRLEAARLAEFGSNKLILIYFSAHWCGPCREFTPDLVRFYNDNKSKGFDLIFVSRDHSREDQINYMKEAQMPWLAVRFESSENSPLRKFSGKGIPCLVLLDEKGAVVSHSYEGEEYVGPRKVMRDLEGKFK